MNKRLPAVVLFSLILLPASARAQERGQFGATMGYPTSVGFIWHATESLALRPEITFTHSSAEAESSIFGLGSTAKNTSFAFTTSALWYRGKFDNVRTYFSPRFTYGQASSKSNSNATPVESDAYSVSGSFGAQYAPTRRFSVFGEIGYGFSRSSTQVASLISLNKTVTRTWSPRSAVGVIFYFGK